MKAKKNPFPDLCLAYMTSSQQAEFAKRIKLTVAIDDPELAFAFKRIAKAEKMSVENFVKWAALSVLESLEDQYKNNIDPKTGMVNLG